MEPVWASEIEPYTIAVTKSRFPDMKHLGSVKGINGAEIEPVDVITAGSPCQNLSMAGDRTGLIDGKRSSLFFDFIRIVKEMRVATDGKYPRYIVWENVVGAFSSNKCEDFRTVLQEITDIASGGGAYLFLNLRTGSGLRQAKSWETITVSPGAHSTRNIGESPRVAVESTLSEILQTDVPEKYFLTKRACEGILRRAEVRAKVKGTRLPQMLMDALTEVVNA